MKENIQSIQTALLVLIAATVVYGTFLKDASPTRRSSDRKRNTERSTSPAAAAQNIPGSNTKITADPSMMSTPPQQPTSQPVNNPTSMAFNEMAHDFGAIDQNTENTHVFNFTNTGDKPLIIETATGSCGCTVPEFPREPIAPGASSQIKVVYKPGKQKGLQNKTVTVIANTQPKDTRLSISANVQEIQ